MSALPTRLLVVAGVTCALCTGALAQNRPTPMTPASDASGASPGTVGAMHGVQPTPGVNGDSTKPKLMRRSPGNSTQTQPASGVSPGAAMGASTPMSPKPSPVGNGK